MTFTISEGDQSKEGSGQKEKHLMAKVNTNGFLTPKVEGKAPNQDPATPKTSGTPPEK